MAVPASAPDTDLPDQALGFAAHGMTSIVISSPRARLTAPTTFSDLVRRASASGRTRSRLACRMTPSRTTALQTVAPRTVHACSATGAAALAPTPKAVKCIWRLRVGHYGLEHRR